MGWVPDAASVVCGLDDRLAWLTARKSGVTATDVTKLVGSSRWGTALDVWDDKHAPPAERSTSVQLVGQERERWVLADFAERSGIDVTPGAWLLRAADDQRYMCTVDGVTDAGAPVEAKNFGTFGDGVPPGVRDQVLWQTRVLGAEEGWAAIWWRDGQTFERVERDEDRLAVLEAAAREFLTCLDFGFAPEPVTAGDAARVVGRGQLEADAELLGLLDERASLRQAVARFGEITDAVKVALAHHEELVSGGETLVTYRADARGSRRIRFQ